MIHGWVRCLISTQHQNKKSECLKQPIQCLSHHGGAQSHWPQRYQRYLPHNFCVAWARVELSIPLQRCPTALTSACLAQQADSVCSSLPLCFLLLWAGIRANPKHEGKWCPHYQVYSLLPNQGLNCSFLLEETSGSTPQSQYLVVAGGRFRFEIQDLCPGGVCGFFRER